MVSLRTLNTAARAALLLISFAGFWTTWGIGKRTGFLDLIASRLKANVQLLPAVEKPLKTTFTGIGLVDRLLRRMTVILWPAIDGTWPGLSLVAFEFSGQMFGTWMVVGLEGLRHGNRGNLLTYTTIVGTLAQVITYCTIQPLYLFIHLLISPTNLGPDRESPNDPATDLLVDPFEVAAWPIAFTLSYLIPTVLAALPSPTYTSFQTHQTFMAFWELYPIPFKIFQIILARWFSSILSPNTQYKSTAQRNARSLAGLRYVYLFSAAVGAISHIITLTLSFSSKFFPTLFSPDTRAGLSPSAVFLGVSPFTTKPVKDMGEGLLHFLTWNMNVSAVAPLLWAALQYRNAHEGRAKWEGWSFVLLKTSLLTMVGGWASAVAALMWARDEMVLGHTGESGSKKYI